MLIESRIHWSIKRNVLKDNMSEDLMWALCIKNDGDEFEKMRFYNQNAHETRSLHSTPEKKKSHEGGRDRSCDDRIFGSASSRHSRRRFKRSSRINSRKSSISSAMHSMQKGKDILGTSTNSIMLESKSLQMLNKEA
mmetsp:Transcript_37178/g.57074  ORF Transcript_37178/g.57074 Transcript_37178/m.57074 type:complete len:137 (-) Transcript_37178:3045-3455(-)